MGKIIINVKVVIYFEKLNCTQENTNQLMPSRWRPKKDFSELSKRSKRRRWPELSAIENCPTNTLLNISENYNPSLVLNTNEDEVLSNSV